jgi:hypothetical protein
LVAAALTAVLIAPGFSSAKSDIVLATAAETTIEGINSGLNGDDSASGTLPIGFDFSFYGQTQSNVFLTTNGVLNFAGMGLSADSGFNNESLNGAGRNHSIFAFWDDLITSGPNKIRYVTVGSAPNRKFVSQWTNVYFFGSETQMGTFQVVLYETTNQIKIQYREIIGGGRSQGSEATIGIKGNGIGQVNQYKSNAATPAINSGTVITYTPEVTDPPSTLSYTVSTSESYDPIFLSVAGSPTKSDLVSPIDDATDVSITPTLQWSQSTGATSYQLMVSTNSSFSSFLSGFPKTLVGNSSTSHTFTTSLNNSTNYFWRVTASNSVGAVSSAASKFTTIAANVSPNTISQVSGDLRDGIEVSANAINTKFLTFTLSDADQGQNVRYRVQISRNSNFSQAAVDYRSDLAAQGVQTFRVGAETGTYIAGSKDTEFRTGNYYIRVRAEDALGAASPWTEFGDPSFKIPAAPTIPPTPAAPTLKAPTKPSNLTATIAGDQVTLKWAAPKDLVANSSNAYIGTLVAGAEILTCETTTLECTIPSVKKNLSYDASVIAKNSAGNSPSSNTVKVFAPELVEVTQGTRIPPTFEPTARRIGLSPLATSAQDQLIKLGIVDAPTTTTIVAVSNDLTNNKFDVETLTNSVKKIAPGTAVGIKLTPPADTPAGTIGYAYLKSPDGEWILLGSSPVVAGVPVSLPPMSFVFPGAYELVWTLRAPAGYQPLGFLQMIVSRVAYAVTAAPELGMHTVRLAVTVEKGSAELPTLVSATPTPTPTPTEVVETPVSPEPVTTTAETTDAPAAGEVVAFSPLDNPAGVADTAVTALALAAAAGAAAGAAGAASGSRSSGGGSSGGGSSGGGSRGEESGNDEGSIATIDIELAGHQSEKLGVGDRFKIWALPIMNFLDKPSHSAGINSAEYSPLISKFIIDGAYLRAMFGSITLLGTVFAMGLGTTSAIALDGDILPPPALVLGIIAVIGVFDALSGFLGMFTFAITALALADERSAGDIRMLMGIVLLGFGPVLLANGARNFRGESSYSGEYIWERITDVAVGAFLAGWSASAMVSVLPALAGLTLPIADSAKAIGLAVAIATIVRIAAEEAAARLFPARLNELHPTEVDDSSLIQKMIALGLRAGVFFFVAAAFIGYEWYLFVGTLLFIIPSYLGLFADRVPNNPTLFQLIPAGLPGLIFSLALGALTVGLIGSVLGDDPLLAKLSFVLVPIPVFIVAILSLIGREPREGDVRWYERDNFKLLYRVGGAVAFFTVLKMTGILA